MAVAFTRGMGVRDPEGLRDDICSGAYPLITAVSRRGVEEYAPVFEPALRRTVTVERALDRETAIKAVMAAADQGAAVLVICNAVRRSRGRARVTGGTRGRRAAAPISCPVCPV